MFQISMFTFQRKQLEVVVMHRLGDDGSRTVNSGPIDRNGVSMLSAFFFHMFDVNDLVNVL